MINIYFDANIIFIWQLACFIFKKKYLIHNLNKRIKKI